MKLIALIQRIENRDNILIFDKIYGVNINHKNKIINIKLSDKIQLINDSDFYEETINGLTCITGKNGRGKTTILSDIYSNDTRREIIKIFFDGSTFYFEKNSKYYKNYKYSFNDEIIEREIEKTPEIIIFSSAVEPVTIEDTNKLNITTSNLLANSYYKEMIRADMAKQVKFLYQEKFKNLDYFIENEDHLITVSNKILLFNLSDFGKSIEDRKYLVQSNMFGTDTYEFENLIEKIGFNSSEKKELLEQLNKSNKNMIKTIFTMYFSILYSKISEEKYEEINNLYVSIKRIDDAKNQKKDVYEIVELMKQDIVLNEKENTNIKTYLQELDIEFKKIIQVIIGDPEKKELKNGLQNIISNPKNKELKKNLQTIIRKPENDSYQKYFQSFIENLNDIKLKEVVRVLIERSEYSEPLKESKTIIGIPESKELDVIIQRNQIEIINSIMTSENPFVRELGEIFEFTWKSISLGEYNLLNLFGRLNDVISSKSNYILLIDEIDIGLHPGWQLQWMHIFLKLITRIDASFQVILTTHSPLLLTDILDQNIIFLNKFMESSVTKTPKTFGQNIQTVLTDSFFIDNTIGVFSKNKINDLINILTTFEEQLLEEDLKVESFLEEIEGSKFLLENKLDDKKIIELVKDKDFSDLNKNVFLFRAKKFLDYESDDIRELLNQLKNYIDVVGEDFYRGYLKRKFVEIESILMKDILIVRELLKDVDEDFLRIMKKEISKLDKKNLERKITND